MNELMFNDALSLLTETSVSTRPSFKSESMRLESKVAMQAAVCALFEGHYHYGLGALANSLYQKGFRGTIWAGYRGELPGWAKPLRQCKSCHEFEVAEGCVICFVPVTTQIHFTNYKPKFMLELWEKYCPSAEALFYFDPDIIIKCRWSFFEEWVGHGIAICQEIVNSTMPSNHPVRMAWQKFASEKGYECQRQLNQYFNGGFLGISKKYCGALEIWKYLIESLEVIDIDITNFFADGDRSDLILSPDQDTLNMMAMITEHPLSTIGPEGMDFVPGGFTMAHAAGGTKPWRKKMTLEALKGIPPTSADKHFWQNTQSPIQLYPTQTLFRKRLDLRCGAAIGRVLRRS